MTTEEKLDRLVTIVETLAGTVAAHDTQIEALIKIGEAHAHRLNELRERMNEVTELVANVEKQWQAYLRTLPRN